MSEPEFNYDAIGNASSNRDVRDAFEDSAVRFVCRKLNLVWLPAQIVRVLEERTSDEAGRGCTFSLFDELTRFPVRLRVGKLRHVRFLSVPDLFNRFPKTPIGQALALLSDQFDPDDEAIGLVFRWAGAKDEDGRQQTIKGGRFMVAHTASVADRDSVRVIAPMKLSGCVYDVVLEPLESLLRAYAGWEPPI